MSLGVEEVISLLKERGISIDRRTFTNYVKWELVSPPEVAGGGRGHAAKYPECVVAETATAWFLLRHRQMTAKNIAEARRLFVALFENGIDVNDFSWSYLMKTLDEQRSEPSLKTNPESLNKCLSLVKTKIWFKTFEHFVDCFLPYVPTSKGRAN